MKLEGSKEEGDGVGGWREGRARVGEEKVKEEKEEEEEKRRATSCVGDAL